jgi:hypothetical protein
MSPPDIITDIGSWQRTIEPCYTRLAINGSLTVATWHHHGDWFMANNNRILLNKIGNQWFAHNHQGIINS